MASTRIEGKVVPILPTHDVDETIDFYERLGFEVRGRFGGRRVYVVLRRDDAELHFFYLSSADPRTNTNGCYLRIEDADALYEEWREVLGRLAPPKDRAWGLREFTLVDPSGNLIRVGSPIRSQ